MFGQTSTVRNLFNQLTEQRIANYGQSQSFLPYLSCQNCTSLGLSQLICLRCTENICFKCLQTENEGLTSDLQLPSPFEKPVPSIPITTYTHYLAEQYYRGQCPCCKKIVIFSSTLPQIFYRLYTSLKFYCVYRVNGCGEETAFPDLRVHEAKCNFRNIICKNNECAQELLQKDLKDHSSYCEPSFQPNVISKQRQQQENLNGQSDDQVEILRSQCRQLQAKINSQQDEIYRLQQNQSQIVTSTYTLSPNKQYQRTTPQQQTPIKSTPSKQAFYTPNKDYLDSPFSLQSLLIKSAKILDENI